MKSATHLTTKVFAAALIALAAWPVTTGPAQADHSWSRLRASDFPARVKAIVFRNTLDANNSVCWGKWCVSFGSERPLAAWVPVSGDVEPGDMSLRVNGLQCENPVVGRKTCMMHLGYTWGTYHSCFIAWELEKPTWKTFKIRCPQNLRLE